MKITTHSNLKSQLYSRKTVHSQVKRALVHVDFPFSVKWEILDVEMEGGRLS